MADKTHEKQDLNCSSDDCNKNKFESLWKINSAANEDLKTLCDRVVQEIQKLTGSEYAYYGLIDPDEKAMTLFSWNSNTINDCNVSNNPRHFPVENAGLWARAVREKMSVIINNYQSDITDKKGTPWGHIQMSRVMAVPLVRNNRVISIVLAANKREPYDDADQKQVESFIDNLQIIIDRKKTEEALRKSEIMHRNILMAAMDGYWMTDTNGFLLEVNETYCKMSGYSSGELIGMNVSRLDASESTEELNVYLKTIMEKGAIRFTRKHKKKDNSLFDVELSVKYLKEGDSGIIIAFLRDITEYKRMEVSLFRSLERLDLATQAAGIGVWDLDIKNRFMSWDDRMYELFGINKEQDPNPCARWMKTLFPLDIKNETQIPAEILNDLKLLNREVDITWPDKSTHTLRAFGKVARSSDGEPVRIVGINYDVTDRKKTEIALRESEQKFRTIVENLNDALYHIDLKGNILDINENACKMTGYEREDLLGSNLFEMNLSENSSHLEPLFEKFLNDESIVFEVTQKRKDGSLLPVEISSKLISREGNGLIQSFVRDITIRKQMEEQLQQAQKMESIGTLAGGIAHDFNNLLSPILIHSEMVMSDLPEDSSLQASMKEIYKAGERARDLVRQILTFARKRNEETVLFNASKVIKDTLKFIRSTIPTTIKIIEDFKFERDSIMADPTQFNQIVMNLCSNAAYAMREKGGELKVEVRNASIPECGKSGLAGLAPGDYLLLKICDTGEGISNDDIEKIFEPYYTTKTAGEGTGLGLSIIHGIVKKYAGEIEVESEKGRGTSFSIYLPLSGEKILETKEMKDEEKICKEHIIVVDDEEAIVKVMEKMLNRLGYTVTTGTSSRKILEIFAEKPDSFDLIITDMTMPEMTGMELAEKMLEIRGDIPIILCTGYNAQFSEESARRAGIGKVIMKPVNIGDMTKKIRDLLDKSKTD